MDGYGAYQKLAGTLLADLRTRYDTAVAAGIIHNRHRSTNPGETATPNSIPITLETRWVGTFPNADNTIAAPLSRGP